MKKLFQDSIAATKLERCLFIWMSKKKNKAISLYLIAHILDET